MGTGAGTEGETGGGYLRGSERRREALLVQRRTRCLYDSVHATRELLVVLNDNCAGDQL